MKIYIDLGCHDGSTIENFLSKHSGFKVYGFDPNNRYKKKWEALRKKYPQITFSHEAANTMDGKTVLNLRPKNNDEGSSIMPQKRDYGDGKKIEVDCFDFSEWIKQFKNDYVWVKFNIEGAEFPIIHKMMKDGTDKIIDFAQIEWHDGKKMPDYESNKKHIWENVAFKWEHWRGI